MNPLHLPLECLPGPVPEGARVHHPKHGSGVMLDQNEPSTPAIFAAVRGAQWSMQFLLEGARELSLDLSRPPLDANGWPTRIDDAATRGCLLALAREAWGDPHLYVAWELTLDGWRWCVMTVAYGGGPLCAASTETEALVLALEAARKRLVSK